MQRGAMFLYVINHKTYHRGWVSEMFFEVAAKATETDLSVYLTRTYYRIMTSLNANGPVTLPNDQSVGIEWLPWIICAAL